MDVCLWRIIHMVDKQSKYIWVLEGSTRILQPSFLHVRGTGWHSKVEAPVAAFIFTEDC